MKYILIAIISLNLAGECLAQYRKDFDLIKDVYHSEENQISFNYTYRYYHDIDRRELLDSLSGDYLMNNGNFIFNSGNYSIYKNQDYFIRINSVEKSISVHKPYTNLNSDLISNLDSLFKLNDINIKEVLAKNSSIRTYRLIQPYGEMTDSVDITFNKNTFLIEKFIVYLKYNIYDDNDDINNIKKPVLEAKFKNHKVSRITPYTQQLFKETPYIRKNNGKLLVKEKYKNYSLSNNLN